MTPLIPLAIFSNSALDALHLTGPGHVECPNRTDVIEKALIFEGLLRSDNQLKPRNATDRDILRCHDANYLDDLKGEIEMIADFSFENDGSLQLSSGDVSICSNSLEVAYTTAGAGLAGVDALMKGIFTKVFCNIRPPGHHAECKRGMGFCLLNNAAIAARYAQEVYKIERVAIIDWDVHHGNGTQQIFYEDPTVFYFSTHRANFYPGTGQENETGKGKGKGYTLNCPIELDETPPRVKILQAFRTKLIPAMDLFKPQLVIISAGFDAREGDPLGGFDLTDKDFEELTFIVRDIADRYAEGRVLSLLEGGYNLDGLASAVKAHVKALISPKPPSPPLCSTALISK